MFAKEVFNERGGALRIKRRHEPLYISSKYWLMACRCHGHSKLRTVSIFGKRCVKNRLGDRRRRASEVLWLMLCVMIGLINLETKFLQFQQKRFVMSLELFSVDGVVFVYARHA